MESEILAADAPLDFVTFSILPDNRYDAYICSNEKKEMVGDGPLDRLLEHLPCIKHQIAKGSCDNFKLDSPNTVDQRVWFTKATLMRFLHVIGSSDLNTSVAISNEMTQLEDTRKFHLSLYMQADGITSADASKNELLRAMDSRLAALSEELVSTFNQAVGAPESFQEITNLQKFCQHFGDVNLRNLLSKVPVSRRGSPLAGPPDKTRSPASFISKNDYVNKSGENIQMVGQPKTLKPVKYNASPAKAAEIERQSSTESDDSSFSSEDDQPPAERSRTLIRSASPRRSASPMRKVQIGRSGSRRTPALAIRSLPYFPSRERISSHRDTGNDSDLEESEETNKKTEVNVTRISVRDAISLFERKPKDEIVDGQKRLSNDSVINTNKAVLRRWSSGVGESQKSLSQDTPENANMENKTNLEEEDAMMGNLLGLDTGYPESDASMKADMEAEVNEKFESNPNVHDGQARQIEENDEKLDSAEWSRQKEAELNQMLMKFSQYSLNNQKNMESDDIKNHNSRLLQKRGLDRPLKERRDEQLKTVKAVKKVEKQLDPRAKKKVLDKPKVEKSSAKASDAGKKQPTSRTSAVNTSSRTLNVNKSTSTSSNSKKEPRKPDALKKAPPRSSPLPATRKSWPLTPSPKVSETVPAKISTRPPFTTSAARQKSQSPAPRQKPVSPAPASRPSPKLERSLLQQKDVKKSQVETKKTLPKVDSSKNRTATKSGKAVKTKAATPPEENVAASAVKPVVRKKGTKKSSVVPLEVKSSSRKVRESDPPVEREITIQAEQPLDKCENPDNITDTVGTPVSGTVQEGVQESETDNGHLELEVKSERETLENENGEEISVEAPVLNDEPVEKLLGSPEEIQPEQETVISPAAWEESGQQDVVVPTSNGHSSSPSPVNPNTTASSGTRVRHSLSQMLLEETSEPDIIEWGNAENPPAMIYQKDAPKGLKRLLKFARKNKGETNGASWASPYTSEGEDDGDEYRTLGKRHSDNLLKVALHSKNHGEGFLSDSEPLSARSNASNSSVRSSNKFQDGHASSKGTRSFFSLSAFRGNKN